MNYNLSKTEFNKDKDKSNLQYLFNNWNEFWQFLSPEKSRLIVAIMLIAVAALANILGPFLIAKAIDEPIKNGDVNLLLVYTALLGAIYISSIISSYFQTRIMGSVSQNTLYNLRTALFAKLQQLPVAFFNSNQSGDLTSRINNDADKINQLLSESILRFLGNFVSVLGVSIFILFLNLQLALVTLVFLIPIIILTQIISPFVENINRQKQAKLGYLASEIQSDLDNFRVIVAFDRRKYFEDKLTNKVKELEKVGQKAEFLNSIFRPIYDIFSTLALISVILFGFYLYQNGEIEIGLLVGFVTYANSLYSPLRILGSIWGNIQSSLGAWERIREILNLESNLIILEK